MPKAFASLREPGFWGAIILQDGTEIVIGFSLRKTMENSQDVLTRQKTPGIERACTIAVNCPVILAGITGPNRASTRYGLQIFYNG